MSENSNSHPSLSHLDAAGQAHMVDVGQKSVTDRIAIAAADVTMTESTWQLLHDGQLPKGDVLAAARIAGIMAAKKTGELIPLCHPLALDSVTVDIKLPQPGQVCITATTRITAKTGVEMEAMTAVSVAALTIYDMCKSAEKGITIGPIRLLEKSGGKSGHYQRSK